MAIYLGRLVNYLGRLIEYPGSLSNDRFLLAGGKVLFPKPAGSSCFFRSRDTQECLPRQNLTLPAKQGHRQRAAAIDALGKLGGVQPLALRTGRGRGFGGLAVQPAVAQVNRLHRVRQLFVGVAVLLFQKTPQRLGEHEQPVNVVAQQFGLGHGRARAGLRAAGVGLRRRHSGLGIKRTVGIGGEHKFVVVAAL